MNAKVFKAFAFILALSLSLSLFAMYPPRAFAEGEIGFAGQTGQGTDEFMGDPQDVYYIDASIQHPDDYTDIVGFRLTVKYAQHSNYGGGKEDDSFRCGMILATKGAHDPSEYNFTYDNGQTPQFDLSPQTVTSFGVGEAGWLISMVFSKGINCAETAVDGDTLVLEYEGDTAVFNEGDPILTVVSFLGSFEYQSVEWISGEPVVIEEEPWDRVETVEYFDIPTVSDGLQNGFNYVDITVPDTGKDSYPVILWIHGGGYITGDRKSCLLSDTKAYLLSRGYAFVNAEYTLTGTETLEDGTTAYTSAGMPQMLYDIKAAVRFLRANAQQYKLNTDYIAAMGESAGAGLSLLLGTSNGLEDYEDLAMGNAEYSSDIQAMVSFCGPSTFTGEALPTMIAYLGGDMLTMSEDEVAELAALWSPTELVHSESPAMFLSYSKGDTTVPFFYAEAMEDAALVYMDKEDVTTVFYSEGGHVDRNIFDTYSAYVTLAAFLDEYKAEFITENAEPALPDVEKPEAPGVGLIIGICAVVIAAVVVVICVGAKKKKSKAEAENK